MSKASDFFNVGSGIWHPLNNTMEDSLQVTSDASSDWQTVCDLVGPVLISSAKLRVNGNSNATKAEMRMVVNGVVFPTQAIDTSSQTQELDLIGSFGIIPLGQIDSTRYLPVEPVYCQNQFKLQIRLVSTQAVPSQYNIVMLGSCAYTFGEYK